MYRCIGTCQSWTMKALLFAMIKHRSTFFSTLLPVHGHKTAYIAIIMKRLCIKFIFFQTWLGHLSHLSFYHHYSLLSCECFFTVILTYENTIYACHQFIVYKRDKQRPQVHYKWVVCASVRERKNITPAISYYQTPLCTMISLFSLYSMHSTTGLDL